MQKNFAVIALSAIFLTNTSCFAASAKQGEIPSKQTAAENAKSLREKIRMLQDRVKAGDQQAMLDLGGFYERGNGVLKSPAKAVKLYYKAVRRGNIQAEVRLGTLYFDGRGVRQNDAKAIEYFQKAADRNDPYAISSLAYAYANGRGVPQDSNKAALLFREASDLAKIQSDARLSEEANEKAEALEEKKAESHTYYKQAINQEYTNVQEATKEFYRAHPKLHSEN
ncbi:sel1 repeat family protein [Acetobacteraceae bacterium]|nr:sel1 repeat family protein [Acetobacteraceae bacterium]